MNKWNGKSEISCLIPICLVLSLTCLAIIANAAETDQELIRQRLVIEAPQPAILLAAEEDESPVPEPRDQSGKNRQAPEQFIDPDNAVPLPGNSTSQQEIIRKFIEVDMRDSSTEEREIWFELLKNEPPELARNLLNLRKTFGSSFTPSVFDTGQSFPQIESEEKDDTVTKSTTLSPTKPPQSLDLDSEELSELKKLWLTVRGMAMFNISQTHIPGYKRLDFVSTEKNELPLLNEDDLVDLDQTKLPDGSYRLELKQGELEETERDLDIALKGVGWLILSHPHTAASCYTRNGRLSRDANGTLVIRAGDLEYSIEPAISLPVDITELNISDTGLVTAQVEESETEMGQIQIARFPNAASLYYQGEGIYFATARTGKPVFGKPLPGMIQQGYLEKSNVDQNSELSNLDRYYEQWKAGLKLMTEYPLLPSE
ncbi:MAG: hypothetical protein KDA65_02830 [Planctomycetaceae bacterium]|nr:hypothetical protein [Planctomycetaceae bacterium]